MLYDPKNSREIPVDMSGLWIFRKFESACASVSLQHKNKETITMENKTTTTAELTVNRTYKCIRG